jgi:uncharacterized Zn-finger protein
MYQCSGSASGSVRIRIFLGLPDLYLDSLIRGTDPRIRILIRIRTKVSRIHNTGTESLGQSGDLQIHLRVPTGEKYFSCPHCIKSFARSGDLQSHLKAPTGEKP